VKASAEEEVEVAEADLATETEVTEEAVTEKEVTEEAEAAIAEVAVEEETDQRDLRVVLMPVVPLKEVLRPNDRIDKNYPFSDDEIFSFD